MSKVDWNEAPRWADEYGFIGCGDPVWSDKKHYQYLDYDPKRYDFGFDAYSYEDFTLAERRPDNVVKIGQPEDLYTIQLDFDSMQEQVVKFLITLYKDNREFDDGCIKDSILQVIEYCTTRDQYAIVKAELGIN